MKLGSDSGRWLCLFNSRFIYSIYLGIYYFDIHYMFNIYPVSNEVKDCIISNCVLFFFFFGWLPFCSKLSLLYRPLKIHHWSTCSWYKSCTHSYSWPTDIKHVKRWHLSLVCCSLITCSWPRSRLSRDVRSFSHYGEKADWVLSAKWIKSILCLDVW